MNQFNDSSGNSSYYKWGIFYCNKTDQHVFVPKQFGFGYTLNFCRSYVIIGSILVLLVMLYQVIFR